MVVARDTAGLVEAGVDGEAAVAVAAAGEIFVAELVGVGRGDVTHDGRDDPLGAVPDRHGDLPDEVVPTVGHIDRAVSGGPDAFGVSQFSVERIAAVAAVVSLAIGAR